MEIKPANVRMLSMLGQRGAFGTALAECANDNGRIVALSADLCNTSGLDRFRAAFPDRFFNVGIAEQNMIGVAAGLAAEGRIPVATTFANFAALRACEQVRHFMGYMRENVKLVGFGAGFSFGMFGTTHYGVEDVAAIRAIPNITIVSPADGLSVVKSVEAMIAHDGPVYLRLTGVMNNPVVYRQDFDFRIGKAVVLREGVGVALIAAGSMVSPALKAADLLLEEGVSATVVDMHTIKPLDTELLDKVFSAHRLVVTVEEHFTLGGLGGAVAEYRADKPNVSRQVMIGVPNEFKKAGSYAYMLDTCGLTAPKIAARVIAESRIFNKE